MLVRRITLALWLFALPAWAANVCTEAFTLRETACAGDPGAGCTTKNSSLTWAELDADLQTTLLLCLMDTEAELEGHLSDVTNIYTNNDDADLVTDVFDCSGGDCNQITLGAGEWLNAGTDDTAGSGLILPSTVLCFNTTDEGQACWDTDDDKFFVGTGGSQRAFLYPDIDHILTTSWSFSGGDFRLPQATTCAAADCNEAIEDGRICYDTDDTTGQRLYACEFGTGWVAQGAAGAGDITDVGDCIGPACFTSGSPDAALTFDNATSGTVTLQTVAGALGTVTASLPAETGTILTSATTLAGDVSGTSGATAVDSLQADALAAVSEIAAAIKRGPDATDTHLLTTDVAAPGAAECLEMDTDGSVILAGAACAGGFTPTDIDTDYGDETVTSTWNFIDNGTGVFGAYDLQVGDTTTPDYGALQIGQSGIYKSVFATSNLDLGLAMVFRQEGNLEVGNDPGIEFAFMEMGNTIRFAIPESGAGNATAFLRSGTFAGPYSAAIGNDIVSCSQWSAYDSNIDCDTTTTGSDLFVQDDLEVEGTIFAHESINLEGATADGNQVILQVGADPGADVTISLPTATDTLVGRDTTDTLTNKSIVATQLTGTVDAARVGAAHIDALSELGAMTCTGDQYLARNTGDTAWECVAEVAGGGDVTAVGAGCDTGECWTDGLATTGTTMAVWEGNVADAEQLTISVPLEPTAAITLTIPDADTATGVAITCGTTDKISAFNATTGIFTCTSDEDSGGTPTQIVTADTSVATADAGAGTVTTTIDATVVGTWALGSLDLDMGGEQTVLIDNDGTDHTVSITGDSTQTGNLSEWYDSTPTLLTAIKASGDLLVDRIATDSGATGLLFDSDNDGGNEGQINSAGTYICVGCVTGADAAKGNLTYSGAVTNRNAQSDILPSLRIKPGVDFGLAGDADNGDAGYITVAVNQKEGFRVGMVASAVNDLLATPAAAGGEPSLSARGADTDIDVVLTAKGAGTLELTGYGSGSKTGTDAFWLAVDSSGNVIEEAAPAGTGDVTDVGDCDGPACFAGAEGTTLTFETAGAADITLAAASSAGGSAITLPDETGTVITTATSSISLSVDHSSTGTLTLDQTVAPTAEGVIAWDVTNEELEVGETTTTAIFKPVVTFDDEEFCSAETTGNQIDCDTPSIGTGSVVLADSPTITTAVTLPGDSVDTGELDDASDSPVEGEVLAVSSTTTQVNYVAPPPIVKTLFDSTNLVATDDIPDIHIFELATIVTDVDCISTGGTSLTLTLEDDAGNDLVTACVCATTLTNCSLVNATFSADERMDWTTVSVDGSTTSATARIEWRYDL